MGDIGLRCNSGRHRAGTALDGTITEDSVGRPEYCPHGLRVYELVVPEEC